MCVCATVTRIYTKPQRQRVLSEAYFKHSPRLSVRALVMSAYLLVFFTPLLICLPQDPKRMTIPYKQHINILMCIDFTHLISHMGQEYKHTLVIQKSTTGHNIHIIASHGSKTTWQNKYLLPHTETQVYTDAEHPLLPMMWPLRRAKHWHNDIEGKHRGSCIKNERRETERGEKRLHPYSISGTSPE